MVAGYVVIWSLGPWWNGR